MRAKLLDSHKITVIEDGGLIDYRGGLINRRNVLIGSGLCAAVVICSPFFVKNEAYAAHPLIDALLAGLALVKEIWSIFQHTEGSIIIVNRYEIAREGFVIFQVVGPRGEENSDYFSYTLPPQYQNTYEFKDGPYGTSPGQKSFTAKAMRVQTTIPMYVKP